MPADGGKGGVGRSARGSMRPPRSRTVQPEQALGRSEGSLFRAARQVVRANAALRAGAPLGGGKCEGGGESIEFMFLESTNRRQLLHDFLMHANSSYVA